MNNDIDDLMSDDFMLVEGRRKKKRGLAANLIAKTSSPTDSGQIATQSQPEEATVVTTADLKILPPEVNNGRGLSLLSETSVEQKKKGLAKEPEKIVTLVKSNSRTSLIKSNSQASLRQSKPEDQITPTTDSSKTTVLIRETSPLAAANDNKPAAKEPLASISTSNDTSLPANPAAKILLSDASPRPASRSRLPNQLLGVSKLAATLPPDVLTASLGAPNKSAGEPTKKTTPRPLPAHLKQAFTSNSNSPRNSLNTSTVQSLTEELAKSISTAATPVNVCQQPNLFMRRVSCSDVRTRSYLVGCLGSQMSLGGKPELDFYFPDRLIRIYAGTFNMGAAKRLPNDLESFVLPDYAASEYNAIAPHIFVFSTQESSSDRHRWLVKLQETLGQHFVCLCSPAFGALGMAIFIRRELVWYTSPPVEATASPKPFQPIATKGSLAIAFELFGTSFLFINSHFAAGEGNIEARIEDYKRTMVELKFPPNSAKSIASQLQQRPLSSFTAPAFANSIFSRRGASASAPSTPPAQIGPGKRPISADEAMPSTPRDISHGLDVTSQFDCTFWMGDFNFRVMRQRQQVDELIKGINNAKNNNNTIHPAPVEDVEDAMAPISSINSHEVLLEHDEMSREMANGRLFTGFHEGRIRFMPSYKFDVGSNKYDTSLKLRIQSYTDRIIFRSRRKNTVTCLAYSSVESVISSDHKPIYGVYDVEIRPGLDAVPNGAGIFDRELYLEGLKQRTQMLTTDKSSAVCTLQ